MNIRGLGGLSAAAALLCAGCYKSPSWSPSGPSSFSARSSTTVPWGVQLEVKEELTATTFGVKVTRQPLCREVEIGTARQPESDVVFKKNMTSATTVVILTGGLMAGSAFSGDETNTGLLLGGIGLVALGLVPAMLPRSKRVERTRSLGEVATFTSEAAPCGEPVAAAGMDVHLDMSNGDDSRAVRFTARTGADGRFAVSRESMEYWAGTCGEAVDGIIEVRAGIDRKGWEADRYLNTRADGGSGFRHQGGGVPVENAAAARTGTDQLWAPPTHATVTAGTGRALDRLEKGQVHYQFASVVSQCVALRQTRLENERRLAWERREREAQAARQKVIDDWRAKVAGATVREAPFGADVLALLPAEVSSPVTGFALDVLKHTDGPPVLRKMFDKLDMPLVEASLLATGLDTRRDIGGLVTAGPPAADGVRALILLKARYDLARLEALLGRSGLGGVATADGKPVMWRLGQRELVLLPGVIVLAESGWGMRVLDVAAGRSPSMRTTALAQVIGGQRALPPLWDAGMDANGSAWLAGYFDNLNLEVRRWAADGESATKQARKSLDSLKEKRCPENGKVSAVAVHDSLAIGTLQCETTRWRLTFHGLHDSAAKLLLQMQISD